MRRRLIMIGLLFLNGLLSIALYSSPAETQVIPASFFDCCKSDGSGAYCCAGCCWFTWNCVRSSDCITIEEAGW